ncbi:hypothetical protein [Streptomyces sp. NPDC048612]|uniref:hypothetical protein n=1 Tax=Streptomyces sp. NPDC048612 TaxID=3365579 RepID=UPI00371765F9
MSGTWGWQPLAPTRVVEHPVARGVNRSAEPDEAWGCPSLIANTFCLASIAWKSMGWGSLEGHKIEHDPRFFPVGVLLTAISGLSNFSLVDVSMYGLIIFGV